MIRKILCYIGWHAWYPVKNNITHPTEVILRTYLKCTHCDKWGELIFYKKVL